MAFPFFPTAYSEPTALRLEYLRSLRSDQARAPASVVVVPEVPISTGFRGIRTKISRRRLNVTASPSAANIDRSLDNFPIPSNEDGCSSAANGLSVLHDCQSNTSHFSSEQAKENRFVPRTYGGSDVESGEIQDAQAVCLIGKGSIMGPYLPAVEDCRLAHPESEHKGWTLNYPSTNMFQSCAALLTHPFNHEFVIDPSKLNVSSNMLSTLKGGHGHKLVHNQLSILDLGGQVSDRYAQAIATVAKARLVKLALHMPEVVQNSSSCSPELLHEDCKHTSGGPQAERPLVLMVEDFSRLPLPSGSIHAISIRSLYKDIGNVIPGSLGVGSPHQSHTAAEKYLASCLRECHRVLFGRGVLEYIHFDKTLDNPGPLTAAMEDFFGPPCFDPKSELVGSSQYLSIDEFLDLLEATGFSISSGKLAMLKFPYITLSKMFTKEGHRRESSLDSFPFEKVFRKQGQINDTEYEAVRRIFTRIEEETAAFKTSWKCVVGWAIKVP